MNIILSLGIILDCALMAKKVKRSFTNVLPGTPAIDDAWKIMIFPVPLLLHSCTIFQLDQHTEPFYLLSSAYIPWKTVLSRSAMRTLRNKVSRSTGLDR